MTNQIQPLISRNRAFMPVQEISRNFSGASLLVVSSTLVVPGLDFGPDTVYVTLTGGDLYFSRGADLQSAGSFVEVPLLPADVLAVVAPAEEMSLVCSLWTGRGLEQPNAIVVRSAVEAIGPILARARIEMAAMSQRGLESHRALVATRREFEETRVAMHGVMRTLSHRHAMKTNLVAMAAPSAGKNMTLAPGEALRQTFPVVADGITCLAFHVAEHGGVADAVFKVLLSGAESGRVLGEWRMPADVVTGGWNVFDLPIPVAAVRESVAVEVSLDGDGRGAMSLSLSEPTSIEEWPLAIRIWTADAGGRFPHAKHWVWNAVGEVRLPAGTVSLLTDDALSRIVPYGPAEVVRNPEAPPLLQLHGGSALLRLLDIPLNGVNGVCIDLGLSLGDVRGTRFELVVQSGTQTLASGWRSFYFPEATLKLGLSLPAGFPEKADLYLRIQDAKRRDGDFAALELRAIECVAGTRSAPHLGPGSEPINSDTLPAMGWLRTGPRFAHLSVANQVETEKYALFEVVLTDLEFGEQCIGTAWFKVSMAKDKLSLEFRRGQKVPEIFGQWPGHRQDRFGDVFQVTDTGEGIVIDGEIAAGLDRHLIAALCALMPTIVATAAQSLPDPSTIDVWLRAARAFAEAARRTASVTPA